MKKILSMLLALAMMFSLVGCSSSDDETTGGEDSGLAVAMISDYADITDQSFNQTTYEACKAWAQENNAKFTYYKPLGETDDDRNAMVDKAVEEGYTTIVMPGYAFGASVKYASEEYPDVNIIGLDLSAGDLPEGFSVDGTNVYCAVYEEELPGYMAGYAAVKMGYTKLGYLGGMAVPAVIRFGYGFVQGANAAAEELGVDVEVKYAYGNQFYGDADITAAMDTWYAKGTEVVFACGGSIYTSACEAADKVNAKVIGVDTDQYQLIKDKGYGEMCITSAMKGLANTVTTLLDAIKDGKFDEYKGKIESLGMKSANPDDNYVALAPNTQWTDGFTEEDYKTLTEKLYNGDIKVSNDTTTEPTVSISVDYQGNIK